MPSKKSGKKGLLQGALKKELKGNGIMQDFIQNVKEEKNLESQSQTSFSGDSGAAKESFLSSASKAISKGPKKGGPPKPPANKLPGWSNSREWWISFSAFITVVLIILGIYYFTNKPASRTFIYLSNQPANVNVVNAHQNPPKLRPGEAVYFHYISDRTIDTKLIQIKIYKMQGMSDTVLQATATYTVSPGWKTFETLFEKKQFPENGRYKIVVSNHNNKVLTQQIIQIGY